MSTDKDFEIFDGKYVLLEQIGRGGRGEVYLARQMTQTGLGKFVAIKRILPEYLKDRTTVDMFRSEANLAIKLKHSNIVSTLESGVFEGQHYIVIDFLEGQTLHSLLSVFRANKKKLPLKYVLFIVSSVALALEYARRATDADTGERLRIVHRDISPHNIMISYEGEVKVIDFGVAGADLAASEVNNQNVMGKFGYMSPEQARGVNIDHQSDLFSLGVVFWEMLTGERMFDKVSPDEIQDKVIGFKYEEYKSKISEFPAYIVKIVEKLLSPSKEGRYEKAKQVFEDVNFILNREFPGFTQENCRNMIRTVFKKRMSELRDKLIRFSKASNEMREKVGGGDVLSYEISRIGSSKTGALKLGEVVFSSLEEEEVPSDTATEIDFSFLGLGSSPERVMSDAFKKASLRKSRVKRAKFGLLSVSVFVVAVGVTVFLYVSNIGNQWKHLKDVRNFTRSAINSKVLKYLNRGQANAVHRVSRSIASLPGVESPQKRGFYVNSSPPGATITVDGVEQPLKTPTYIYLEPGSQPLISLELNGYTSFSSRVNEKKGRLTKRLRPASKE